MSLAAPQPHPKVNISGCFSHPYSQPVSKGEKYHMFDGMNK